MRMTTFYSVISTFDKYLQLAVIPAIEDFTAVHVCVCVMFFSNIFTFIRTTECMIENSNSLAATVIVLNR